jgi:hypothetical protein
MPTSAVRYTDIVLRGLMVALFTIAGAMKLTAHPFEVHGFAHFGYAPWFMYVIGAIEFVAAFALLNRRTIAPATAILIVVLIGAVGSHLRVGDPIPMMLPAIISLLVLVTLGFIRRPRTRLSLAA